MGGTVLIALNYNYAREGVDSKGTMISFYMVETGLEPPPMTV